MSYSIYKNLDWKKILQTCSSWKHKKRRKFIKKIKRSYKRKSLINNQSKVGYEYHENIETNNCCTNENQSHSFGSIHDFVAREIAHTVLKQLISLVCNDFYLVDKIEPSKLEFQQHVHENEVIDQSANTLCETLSSVDESGTPNNLNLNSSNENCDIEKTIETERFLEELDEEVKKWHNPFLPEIQSSNSAKTNDYVSEDAVFHKNTDNAEVISTSVTPILESKVVCRFYEKVGSCRFGDNCSRHHEKVSSSKTLLLQGMFSTFAFDIMERAKKNEHGDADDVWLEHSDADLYDEFVEFYNDVIPELESYGKIKQFKVCCNRDKHLLGNVYVQYKHERDAVKAANHLNGRFYAGKHLNVKFVSIKSWKSAICGLHYNNLNCPRGHHCNFLHVFKEPSRRFYDADVDNTIKRQYDNTIKSRNSEMPYRDRNRNSRRGFDRYDKNYKRYSSNEDSPYRNRRKRSKDREKKHHKHKKSHKKSIKKHKHKKNDHS